MLKHILILQKVIIQVLKQLGLHIKLEFLALKCNKIQAKPKISEIKQDKIQSKP